MIVFRLDSARVGEAALRLSVFVAILFLFEGLFFRLALQQSEWWWLAFVLFLPLGVFVLKAGKRVLLMIFEWPALEITECEIIDRRGVVPRRWPLADVGVLSPPMESLLEKPESLTLVEIALGLENFVVFSIRKKGESSHIESVFSDYVEFPIDSQERAQISGALAALAERHAFTNELLISDSD